MNMILLEQYDVEKQNYREFTLAVLYIPVRRHLLRYCTLRFLLSPSFSCFCILHLFIHILILPLLYIASNPDSIKELFAKSVEAFGTVDVLINNAGITRDGLVMRMKPQAWQDVIDTNLSGVFYCTQAFFKLAAKKRTGRIINISSVVGQIGNPGQANYAAAKGGVIALTMSNAKEFAMRNVVVNCVCPGFIETDMTAELDEKYLESVTAGIPLKRLGKPEEVSGMCRFLALDPAVEYITGHTFNVDGGIAMGC
jgi:3-oxoacyl-[acyl-carrier protein] reductase